MKTGRLSKEEWNFIERNADRMTPEQIAQSLDRDIDPVLLHLRKIGKSLNKADDYKVQAEYDLKSRPYWKELKGQFSEEELELFVYHWKQIVGQFHKDVLPTEELQIVDTVKLEVLMNRALREQRESMLKVVEFSNELEKEKRKPAAEQDRELIFSLERQCTVMRAAKEALSREFKDLQTKKSALYKDMKATRDQRLDKIQDNKMTFASLIEKLIKNPQFVEEQSIAMEKMRLALEKEKQRLGSFHKFADGSVDQCLINEETVDIGEEND